MNLVSGVLSAAIVVGKILCRPTILFVEAMAPKAVE